MIRLILHAVFKNQGDACCAMLDVNGVRFYSLPPKDSDEEEKINKAVREFAVKPDPPKT
jgi:hypothetical protein